MHLYLECATGIGGDMLVAALADLGADLEPLRSRFGRAGLGIDFSVSEELRNGLRGRALQVSCAKKQPLRRLDDLLGALWSLDLPSGVTGKCELALQRLAEVEALVHGVSVDDVHFHEVGAADTLVDITAVFFALDNLGVGTVLCNTLPWFQGRVECAHGVLPLPAPAAVELLKGKPVWPSGSQMELITPTGALLVDQVVTGFAGGPQGKVLGMGAGWGSHDLGRTPNMLRVFSFERSDPEVEEVWVLETNIDHLTGEEIGSLFDPLFSAGAADVLYLPGVMKKNRTGGQLQVMCEHPALEAVQEALFTHSLTLGVRRRRMERVVLPRRGVTIESRYGPVEAKAMELGGRHLARAEYEALKRLAARTGRSVAELRYLLVEGDTNRDLRPSEQEEADADLNMKSRPHKD
ncbi:MAG: LarC family nickel insertion protein [Desulfohalobiaceae bacterium]